MTAVSECTQGFSHRLQPLTMCEYDVECAEVADLRDEKGRKRHGVDLLDLACGWLTCLRDLREAPSWLVADTLRNEDFYVIILPILTTVVPASLTTLLLFLWGPVLPHLSPMLYSC